VSKVCSYESSYGKDLSRDRGPIVWASFRLRAVFYRGLRVMNLRGNFYLNSTTTVTARLNVSIYESSVHIMCIVNRF
jgi:hypothetical protein